MAFAGEEVGVSLDGVLKGVSEVARSYDEDAEIATVTLRLPLEPEIEPFVPKQSLTMEQRKAQAEEAARIHATALLREQIGQSYIERDIRIKDFTLVHQEVRVHVEGLLEGIRFSDVRWSSEAICEVTASLEIDAKDLDELTMKPDESELHETPES
jgi:hypothetical protein